MPTRIVLKESVAPSPRRSAGSPPRTNRFTADFSRTNFPQTSSPPAEPNLIFLSNSRKRRSFFRSSILQQRSEANNGEENVSVGSADGSSHHLTRSRSNNHYSSDIRASPRLLGYVFALTACAIMLASVVQFLRSPGTVPPEFQDYFDSGRYFVTSANNVILWWKVWGAVAVSACGCLVYLLIILAHFDTVCLPNLWVRVFRDGSLAERNLLLLLIVFWIAGLNINTGSLSAGEWQPNVFFTTWIAFCATVNNFAVWRESAGLRSWFDREAHARESTYNWLWTAFFSLVLAGSVSDVYYYRDEITLQSNGQKLNISQTTWIIILSLAWAFFGICCVAILLNCVQVEPYTLPCHCRRHEQPVRCVLGWRHLEGLVLILAVGVTFYVVLVYTGVDTVVNGLSNAYIGMWGTFFSSVSTFGTWLKENRNITYFIPDLEDDEPSQEEPTGRQRKPE